MIIARPDARGLAYRPDRTVRTHSLHRRTRATLSNRTDAVSGIPDNAHAADRRRALRSRIVPAPTVFRDRRASSLVFRRGVGGGPWVQRAAVSPVHATMKQYAGTAYVRRVRPGRATGRSQPTNRSLRPFVRHTEGAQRSRCALRNTSRAAVPRDTRRHARDPAARRDRRASSRGAQRVRGRGPSRRARVREERGQARSTPDHRKARREPTDGNGSSDAGNNRRSASIFVAENGFGTNCRSFV